VGRDVFNNTALVYSSKANVLQGRNFLRSALDDGTAFGESAKYSSRWIENGSFLRLQNLTVGYNFRLPGFAGRGPPPGSTSRATTCCSSRRTRAWTPRCSSTPAWSPRAASTT
jgi:hypothetical protein